MAQYLFPNQNYKKPSTTFTELIFIAYTKQMNTNLQKILCFEMNTKKTYIALLWILTFGIREVSFCLVSRHGI